MADGINPSKVILNTSTGAHACLILDAKSSKASERNSLYGVRDNDFGFWDWVRRRPRPAPRRPNPRRMLVDSADTVLDTLQVLMGENGELTDQLSAQSNDPQIIEDTPDDDSSPFADERDETDSAHRAVRFNQIAQMMEYERACCIESDIVPFTKYLIIVERPFMVEYFRSILTPNGIVVRSAYGTGETWAP
ncbi:hypothetical protein [Nereida sp. MMG025]|uniref:hypothetical protein n=1 Tax=Nereida sp. MMG025 TaxID=2909981 RepID=UPI001F204A22|nr:hypothetical protein [Nereida sp. MMG025]MCF6446180.1 hypothetical protein [Nereida sp. MMG025]